MRYDEWLKTWLENYVKPAVKQRTYEIYKDITYQHLVGRLGSSELEDLLPAKLQQFAVSLLSGGNLRVDGGLQPNSVNGIITVLQHSLKTAYNAGEVTRYIGNAIKRPAVAAPEINCFTIEEQKKIEEEITSRHNVKMYGVIVCMYTGLRIGELLALEKTDVDLDRRCISVTKSCRDAKYADGVFTRRTGTPKTISSKRLIPISNQLMPYIKVMLKTGNSKYLVNSKDGKVLAMRSYQRSFELLLKRLNIPHKGFHALRHTFATRAIERGVDVKTLAEVLGHKNPMITLKYYTHCLDEHKNAMMNKVGELLEEEKIQKLRSLKKT